MALTSRYPIMTFSNNTKAFFELLRAGFWNSEVRLEAFKDVDFEEVYRLAEEQSVIGLVLEGIERSKIQISSSRVPQMLLLQWIGEVQQLEQQNEAMNDYVAWLIEKLREEDIDAVLVKGQGVAQCYEKPLWRCSGDVDLLLSEENYQRAKAVLSPLAEEVEREFSTLMHQGMIMPGGYVVELHGNLHSRLSWRVDSVIDEARDDVFYSGNVRSWQNGKTLVFLPGINSDVIFLFTHILSHFYIEGIGLRQICDLSRFLWTYKDSLDYNLLESRIKKMGLLSEWKAFAALSVEYLGTPVEAMPLYSDDKKWFRKADRMMEFVLECGNFGHNRQRKRLRGFLGGKISSVWRKAKDFGRHASVFPIDSGRFFLHFVGDGIKNALGQKGLSA